MPGVFVFDGRKVPHKQAISAVILANNPLTSDYGMYKFTLSASNTD